MMTTLQTSVEVTEERRLRLDIRLPEDLPTGYADVRIHIVPSNGGKDAPSVSIREWNYCPLFAIQKKGYRLYAIIAASSIVTESILITHDRHLKDAKWHELRAQENIDAL